MSRNQILTLGLSLGFVTVLMASNARATDPKPSQLITVKTGSTTCSAGPFSGKAFDEAPNPDGTQGAFSIPAGQVLVITDTALGGTGGGVGNRGELDVLALPAGSRFNQSFITIDSSGSMTRQFTFPSGVAVKSGVTLCAFAIDETVGASITVDGTVHGYFAPDR